MTSVCRPGACARFGSLLTARAMPARPPRRARIEALLARIEERFVARGGAAAFNEGDRLGMLNAQRR